ncbi:MAG: Hsp20/alpha crystallin family protein [Acidimicrobiales bacterium]|jgi:HSP20 family protein
MTMIKHQEARKLEPFDRFFGQWPEIFHRPLIFWPEEAEATLRVEEYQENGTRVIRAEMPGIDPDKDVEVTVLDGVLHIGAQRLAEEKSETKRYARRELRYGSFSRDLPLPEGCAAADVKATYKDGILEFRLPAASMAKKAEPKKIPVAKV